MKTKSKLHKKSILKKKVPATKYAALPAGTAQGIGARENQQDSCCVSGSFASGFLAMVADGMGGLKNGAEVSSIVTYVFKEYFEQLVEIEFPENELLQMLREANIHVRRYMENEDEPQSGSTAAAVYIRKDRLYYLSVGDSRIYLLRNGGLIQLNREHIYAYELDEKVVQNRISLKEALNHRERNALTSYVGMDEISAIDRNLTPLKLCKGDKLLLATDGVFDTLSEQEMEEALQRAKEPGMAAALLEAMVGEKNRPGQDNSTVVVIFYEQAGSKRSKSKRKEG